MGKILKLHELEELRCLIGKERMKGNLIEKYAQGYFE